jgi:hypothetical protein
MALALQHARPVVRAPARFHDHQATRVVAYPPSKTRAGEALPPHDPIPLIGLSQLKAVLCQRVRCARARHRQSPASSSVPGGSHPAHKVDNEKKKQNSSKNATTDVHVTLRRFITLHRTPDRRLSSGRCRTYRERTHIGVEALVQVFQSGSTFGRLDRGMRAFWSAHSSGKRVPYAAN